MSAERPETPDEELSQDPGIPGVDAIADASTPIPDEQDESVGRRERLDDVDEEGHLATGEPDEPA
ncbi:MAG TPA: hypothetical protein VLB86_09395 [Gaiellaceae bacterium]|nr:hypothetical protein [Gaiellaceae bacterium]